MLPTSTTTDTAACAIVQKNHVIVPKDEIVPTQSLNIMKVEVPREVIIDPGKGRLREYVLKDGEELEGTEGRRFIYRPNSPKIHREIAIDNGKGCVRKYVLKNAWKSQVKGDLPDGCVKHLQTLHAHVDLIEVKHPELRIRVKIEVKEKRMNERLKTGSPIDDHGVDVKVKHELKEREAALHAIADEKDAGTDNHVFKEEKAELPAVINQETTTRKRKLETVSDMKEQNKRIVEVKLETVPDGGKVDMKEHKSKTSNPASPPIAPNDV